MKLSTKSICYEVREGQRLVGYAIRTDYGWDAWIATSGATMKLIGRGHQFRKDALRAVRQYHEPVTKNN